jgi:ribonucleotide monophosphatase NagD (HAD superfamily)
MSILVDINGTIIREGKPIQSTIDYLHSVTEDIYVISGSTTSKLKYYSEILTNLGINYKKIIFNPV